MLVLKDITKNYYVGNESVSVLKGINFEFSDIGFTSILGQSGSGKTTLLNIIGGLDKYTRSESMETIMNWWLSIWLYVMTAIAIILVIKVIKNKDKWTKLNIFCTLAIVVLVLHVLEEWVFPGGLHYSYNINHGSNILSAYPMNRLTDMITNFGGVILGIIILKFWGFKKPAGLAVMIFCFAEVMIHVLIGIQDLGIFAPYGARFFYDPGLVTSLFGFLPLGILLGIELFKNKPRPTFVQWILALGGTFIFAFLLINLPEGILKDENNPYYFTDRGYYEKYGEEYEKDNNVQYIIEENK